VLAILDSCHLNSAIGSHDFMRSRGGTEFGLHGGGSEKSGKVGARVSEERLAFRLTI